MFFNMADINDEVGLAAALHFSFCKENGMQKVNEFFT